MIVLVWVLLVLAACCLLLAAARKSTPQVDLQALGLLLWLVAVICMRFR